MAPRGDATTGSAAWEALRKHALFPKDRASRERLVLETAIGELGGWIYRVKGEEDTISEFFFADAFPGPPVVYLKQKAGQTILRVEQIERRRPES